jgi:hypothetical protein
VNRRMVARAGGLAIATVMTVTPSSCRSWHDENYGPYGHGSSYNGNYDGNYGGNDNGNEVVVSAGPGDCWTTRIDSSGHDGCGNARFPTSSSSHHVQIVKHSGNGSVHVSMVSNGRTLGSTGVSSAGHYSTMDSRGN